MKILINTLAIVDSGGVTVLASLLEKIAISDRDCLICYYHSLHLDTLISQYIEEPKLTFIGFPKRNFLHRLFLENIIFTKLIKDQKIDFIYNFSGSAQPFIKVPQIIKLQNMMFYSNKLDHRYGDLGYKKAWIKQIWLKRQIFKFLYKDQYYFEIQADHVADGVQKYLSKMNHYYTVSDINVRDSEFTPPKNYDFNKPLNFLFIVGPHYDIVHKNFRDFMNIMKALQQYNIKYTITITLDKQKLQNSNLWYHELNELTQFTGYLKHNEIKNLFLDNTILVSTSIIETLGLHVVEAIKNGILVLVPNEPYSQDVYGQDVSKYELYNINSAIDEIFRVIKLSTNEIKDKIHNCQSHLISTEKKKFKTFFEIIDIILKGHDVQK